MTTISRSSPARILVATESADIALPSSPVRVHLEREPATAQLDPRRQNSYARLIEERLRGRGWDRNAAVSALNSPLTRALARLLNREFDAALLAGSARSLTAASALVEAEPGFEIAPVWLARSAGATAADFAWSEWSAGKSPRLLSSTARWLNERLQRPMLPVVVNFAAGKHTLDREVGNASATLEARGEAAELKLYSGLFYDKGRLLASALAAEILKRLPAGRMPLITIAQLKTDEFAEAYIAEGGHWAGSFLAGAEQCVATVLATDEPPADLDWTLALLASLAPRQARTTSESA